MRAIPDYLIKYQSLFIDTDKYPIDTDKYPIDTDKYPDEFTITTKYNQVIFDEFIQNNELYYKFNQIDSIYVQLSPNGNEMSSHYPRVCMRYRLHRNTTPISYMLFPNYNTNISVCDILDRLIEIEADEMIIYMIEE